MLRKTLPASFIIAQGISDPTTCLLHISNPTTYLLHIYDQTNYLLHIYDQTTTYCKQAQIQIRPIPIYYKRLYHTIKSIGWKMQGHLHRAQQRIFTGLKYSSLPQYMLVHITMGTSGGCFYWSVKYIQHP